MQYIASVRAALRASAPVVAIPIEGRAPVCIRARLLKGALKGVTIHSVTVLENGSLKITGTAEGSVRTSSTFIPVNRQIALREIREWSYKEHAKRVKQINHGVLSAQEQRALKLKKAEQESIAVLKQAQKDVEDIYRQAREHISPVMFPASEDHRKTVLTEYREYRAQQPFRKRGATIRWQLAELRKELETVSVMKGKRRERKKRYAKAAKHVPRMLAIMRELAALDAAYKALIPDVWHPFEYHSDGGYWIDPWIAKRPKAQTCTRKDYWREDDSYNRKALCTELIEARANIRALTPPEDELTEERMAA